MNIGHNYNTVTSWIMIGFSYCLYESLLDSLVVSTIDVANRLVDFDGADDSH